MTRSRALPIQNIPIRSDLGRRLRQAFLDQRPSRILLDSDYSAIELKIIEDLKRKWNRK